MSKAFSTSIEIIIWFLSFVFFFHLFLFIGGYLFYNIVVVFAIHWYESATDLHVFPIPIFFPPPSPPHPSGSSQCTRPEHLSHASNLGWWSVSPLIIYMLRCCSLKTSHPHLQISFWLNNWAGRNVSPTSAIFFLLERFIIHNTSSWKCMWCSLTPASVF